MINEFLYNRLQIHVAEICGLAAELFSTLQVATSILTHVLCELETLVEPRRRFNISAESGVVTGSRVEGFDVQARNGVMPCRV